jgi:hypothetical protein
MPIFLGIEMAGIFFRGTELGLDPLLPPALTPLPPPTTQVFLPTSQQRPTPQPTPTLSPLPSPRQRHRHRRCCQRRKQQRKRSSHGCRHCHRCLNQSRHSQRHCQCQKHANAADTAPAAVTSATIKSFKSTPTPCRLRNVRS